MQNSDYIPIKTASSTKYVRSTYKGTQLDFIVTSPLVLLLTPIFIFNSLYALCCKRRIFNESRELDALGRLVIKRSFSSGIYKHSAFIFDIWSHRYALCGVSSCHRLDAIEQSQFTRVYDMPSGLFSLVSINRLIGLDDISAYELLTKQAKGGYLDYVFLLLKGLLSKTFMCSGECSEPRTIEVFDIKVMNVKMKSAVNMVLTNTRRTNFPQTFFFINAHSLNLSKRDKGFLEDLNQSTCSFADGSGIRLASLHKGQKLKDNVNGTDMLPVLCKAAQKKHKKIYLLGAKQGVAAAAGRKLKKAYPNLQIVGTEHGYHDNYDGVIKQINAAQPDILLVGMGSPYQERWILDHQKQLNCTSILAVGGLFDFFSNRIPRAPRWMRETGLEWLFRLYKEPLAKFSRYVIGTPELLVRIFLLKQA